MRFLGYQGADLPCPSQHCCPWPMNGLEGKEQLWGLSFWKVNGSKREGSILCPALQHRESCGGEWLPPRNWESGCMCGHAGQLGPLPPHGQPGELLIRRDSFQSHGMPLIKQTSISRWPEGGKRRPSPGGAHISSKNAEASGSGQNPPSLQWKPSPRQLSSCCTRCWEGEPSLRSTRTRPEPHPASSLLCPLASPISTPDSFCGDPHMPDPFHHHTFLMLCPCPDPHSNQVCHLLIVLGIAGT